MQTPFDYTAEAGGIRIGVRKVPHFTVTITDTAQKQSVVLNTNYDLMRILRRALTDVCDAERQSREGRING